MITVQFPAPQFNIKCKEGKRYIFDGIRRRWLVLTEEEWVRQNMVAYFLSIRYPKEAMALEKAIVVNGLKKRFDLLLYNKLHQPWMLVECKAPQVPLTEDVLQQALRYNMVVPANWIVITNGEKTVGWKKEKEGLLLVSTLPEWGE